MRKKISLLFLSILLTISISNVSYSDEFDEDWVSPYNELCDFGNTRLENVKIWHCYTASQLNITWQDRSVSNLLKIVGNNTEELLHEVNVETYEWTDYPFVDSNLADWSDTYGYCVYFDIVDEIDDQYIIEVVDHYDDVIAIDNYTEEYANVWRVVQIMSFAGPYFGNVGLSADDPREKLSLVRWSANPVVYMHEYGHIAVTRFLWSEYEWPTINVRHYDKNDDPNVHNENLNVMYKDTSGGKDGDLAYKPYTQKYTYNY